MLNGPYHRGPDGGLAFAAPPPGFAQGPGADLIVFNIARASARPSAGWSQPLLITALALAALAVGGLAVRFWFRDVKAVRAHLAVREPCRPNLMSRGE